MRIFEKQTLDFVVYCIKAYPWRTAVMVALLILSGLAEGIGIIALLPVLQVVMEDGGDSRLTRAVHGFLGIFGVAPTLGSLLVLMVFGIVLKSGFLLLAMKQVGYTVAHVGTDMRLRFLRTVLRARWGYFTSQPVGHFSNAISAEAHRASLGYKEVGILFAVVVQTAVYLAIAIALSWQLATIAMVAGLILIFVLSGFIRMSRRAGKAQTQLKKALVARLTDALHGIKPIKAMAREDHLWPILKEATLGLNKAQQKYVLAAEALKSFHEPVMVVLLAIGLYAMLTVGNMPFAEIVVMAVVFQRLMGRINALQNHYQTLVSAESAFWSLQEDLELASAEREQVSGQREPPPLETGIRLESVDFAYGKKQVLRDVSLTIPAGQLVALIGPSGAGKTTIADLVLGLYRPDRGEVYIDDVPLADIDFRAWRREIGYVPQEMFLFHDTILRNVTLGSEDITREAVEEALHAAGAWEFVSRLPAGIDTVVGERGSRLSGGQRQRIAIARAMVTHPKLLVLDEVTTALDAKTEASICATLRELSGKVTIISISHQPAMMEVADLVYRLENGAVTPLRQDEPLAHTAVA